MRRHYASLAPPERFALVVEAMARRDFAEADRLEDSCPRFTYRAEDAEYRDRMRRSFAIAAMACLNMRGGLAQLRMTGAFSEVCKEFAGTLARFAEVAFLYGRAYGHWEAGAVDRRRRCW
jgi:hypothetical protein